MSEQLPNEVLRAERLRSRILGLVDGFEAGASTEVKELEKEIAEKDATIERLEADYAAYREVLKRNKQGCQNILEFRKLSSDAWGQRDGYGGRYGALTREELEDVIAEIDTVLTNPAGAELLERLREAEGDVAFLKACNQTMAERISRLDEPWVDEHGESWTAPTAHAYAMVCRARDKHAAKASLADELARALKSMPGPTHCALRLKDIALDKYESLNASQQPGEGGSK